MFGEAKGATLDHWYHYNGSGWVTENLGGNLHSAPSADFDGTELNVFGRTGGGALEHYWYPVASHGWHTESLGGSVG